MRIVPALRQVSHSLPASRREPFERLDCRPPDPCPRWLKRTGIWGWTSRPLRRLPPTWDSTERSNPPTVAAF